jgi:hypothetical protein
MTGTTPPAPIIAKSRAQEFPSTQEGLFGRHAADAMRWSGGCGGCWSPPGHRPGWCHLPKWSSTRTLRVTTLGKAVLLERRGFSRIVPAWRLRPGSVEDSARQAASSRLGARRTRSSRSTTPSQVGRKVGGLRKAPSVSTWPIHPRAGAYKWVVQWGKDGACSPRGSKDPCGHSWWSDSIVTTT